MSDLALEKIQRALLAEHEPDVDPIRQHRLFRQFGDPVVPVELNDPERAVQGIDRERRQRPGFPVLALQRRQVDVGQDVAVADQRRGLSI